MIHCLQFSNHKNTPASWIVYAAGIYYPLLYGSIVSYRRACCKPLLVLTLTYYAARFDAYPQKRLWDATKASHKEATRQSIIASMPFSVYYNISRPTLVLTYGSANVSFDPAELPEAIPGERPRPPCQTSLRKTSGWNRLFAGHQ